MTGRLTDEQLREMTGWSTKPRCLQDMATELLALRARNAKLDEAYVKRAIDGIRSVVDELCFAADILATVSVEPPNDRR